MCVILCSFKKTFGGLLCIFFLIGQLKSGQTMGEKEGMACSKGRRVESHLWSLQRGNSLHTLCTPSID